MSMEYDVSNSPNELDTPENSSDADAADAGLADVAVNGQTDGAVFETSEATAADEADSADDKSAEAAANGVGGSAKSTKRYDSMAGIIDFYSSPDLNDGRKTSQLSKMT